MGRRPGHLSRLVVSRCNVVSPLADLVADYLAAAAARGLSPYTVAYRSQVLARFVEWCDERGIVEPAGVDRRLVERYQRHLFYRRKTDGTPLKFVSQHNQLTAVKSLFSWACRAGLIGSNPASELDMPKIERTLPKDVLNPAEIEKVLAVADIGTVIGLRDRAMMEVLYSTGMRRAEICALRLHDLDGEAQTVTVRQGKGRRDRVIPVGERALIWVDRYLADSRPVLDKGASLPWLFVARDATDLTPDHLTIRVGRYIRAATGKTGSCHAFRHAMATAMLEGGADIRYVQEMLGHALLETTVIYTRVTIDDLKKVHAACHPAATNTRHRSPTVSEPRSATGDTAALHNHPYDRVEEPDHDQPWHRHD